jgi:hypothetical protein
MSMLYTISMFLNYKILNDKMIAQFLICVNFVQSFSFVYICLEIWCY